MKRKEKEPKRSTAMVPQPDRLTMESIKAANFGTLSDLFDTLKMGIDVEEEMEMRNTLMQLLKNAKAVERERISQILNGCFSAYKNNLQRLKAIASKIKELFQNQELLRIGAEDFTLKIDQKFKHVDGEMRVLIIGENSCGKSLILNLVCCEGFVPSYTLPCTPTICELRHGEKKEARIHFTDPEKDALTLDLEVGSPAVQLDTYFRNIDRTSQDIRLVELFFPCPFLQGGIVLVDSPGLGESEAMNQYVADYAPKAHGIIFVIDASHGVREVVAHNMSVVFNQRAKQQDNYQLTVDSLMFLCTKWDLLAKQEVEEVRNHILLCTRKVIPDCQESQFLGIDAKGAFDYLSLIGGINGDHQKFHEKLLQFLGNNFSNQLKGLSSTLIGVLQGVSQKIEDKIFAMKGTVEEREERLRNRERQLQELERFQEFDRISQDAEYMLTTNCKGFCESEINELTERAAHEAEHAEELNNHKEDYVVKRLNKIIERKFYEQLTCWEASQNAFASVKKALVAKLQEEAGEFFDTLYSMQAGSHPDELSSSVEAGGGIDMMIGSKHSHHHNSVLKQHNLTPKKLAILAGLTFPISVPLAVVVIPAFFAHKTYHEWQFGLKYNNHPEIWRKVYVEKSIFENITPEYVRKRAEAMFFSPEHYMKQLKEAIKQVTNDQKRVIDDLRSEKRSHEALMRALQPIKDQIQAFIKQLQVFDTNCS